MLQKYKEIFYGVAFGVGAAVMDTVMDAHMEGHDVWTELVQHPPMLFYRSLLPSSRPALKRRKMRLNRRYGGCEV